MTSESERQAAPEPAGPVEQRPRHRGLRRAGGWLLAVAIGLAAVVGLMLVLNARDDAGVQRESDAGPVPGTTVSAAADRLVGAQQQRLLALGDVILLYGTARPPAQLVALRQQLSGPPDPALTNTGQAVLLQRRPGTGGVIALAWHHELRAADARDPRLEQFASYWLGRGSRG